MRGASSALDHYRLMMSSNLPKPDDLVLSASRFARRALDSHNSEEFELVPFFAATSIEHITKACLITRHPTLLLQLQGRDNYETLLFLIGVEVQKPTKFMTVGLKESLERLKKFVSSSAIQNDLFQLIDLRDGSVHIANREAVEAKLLVAFVRQIQASLFDLRINSRHFWLEHTEVVDTILSEDKDRLEKSVKLKIQQSQIRFEKKTTGYSSDTLESIRNELNRWIGIGQEIAKCPACASFGVAEGVHQVRQLDYPLGDYNLSVDDLSLVNFSAHAFNCPKCHLTLESQDELRSAGMILEWTSDADSAEVNNYNFEWLKDWPSDSI